MTSYALTLIGNAHSFPLSTLHIELVHQCLDLQAETDWLEINEACDLLFDSHLSAKAITGLALKALSGYAIDAVCVPIIGRRKKLLISDMDSTIINQECIDELADVLGVGSKIRAITESVVQGNIGFAEGLRKRLALMKGMEDTLLEHVYEQRITLKKGAGTLVQTMRRQGAFCILVSGGFTYFTSRIATRLGFDDHQGNELIFKNGKLTGEVQDPILDKSAKLHTLMTLCDKKGLTPADVLAVGDGANDRKMIQAAGLGVAFHDAGSLSEQSNARIEYADLTALLYMQGYRKSEFVLTYYYYSPETAAVTPVRLELNPNRSFSQRQHIGIFQRFKHHGCSYMLHNRVHQQLFIDQVGQTTQVPGNNFQHIVRFTGQSMGFENLWQSGYKLCKLCCVITSMISQTDKHQIQ